MSGELDYSVSPVHCVSMLQMGQELLPLRIIETVKSTWLNLWEGVCCESAIWRHKIINADEFMSTILCQNSPHRGKKVSAIRSIAHELPMRWLCVDWVEVRWLIHELKTDRDPSLESESTLTSFVFRGMSQILERLVVQLRIVEMVGCESVGGRQLRTQSKHGNGMIDMLLD